jgi:hypothetical protein
MSIVISNAFTNTLGALNQMISESGSRGNEKTNFVHVQEVPDPVAGSMSIIWYILSQGGS